MNARSSILHPMRVAAVLFVGLALLAPALLDSQRRGGGGGGGGGRVSAGSSVRQSHTASRPTPQASSSSRPSTSATRPSPSTRQTTPSTKPTLGNQANRPTTSDQSGGANAGNRATNVDQSQRTNIQNKDVNVDGRDINVNGDVNIDADRDFDDVDFDNVENVHISGGEYNVWVNEGNIHVYEDYEGWKVFAGVTTAIAVGTMLAQPPVGYTTVYVGPTPYYYYDNAYYSQAYSGGEVAYQVVAPPVGVVITTLPAGCVQSGVYWTCGSVYYQRSGSGYAVIAKPF